MSHTKTIGLVSLGCAKNLVDTERLTSALVSMGYKISGSYESCDLVIVNTCGFINPAVQESLEAIGEALNYQSKVIVMGCLGAKPQTILDAYPQVLKVFGPGRRAAVLREIVKVLGQPPQDQIQTLPSSGIILTPPHYAYLKIAEGCRHRCAFCIIPSLRGALRSRLPKDILKEAQSLKERDVKELLVIAQDSSDYGFDLKLENKPTITSLCKELAKLNLWVRVHYVYPSNEATSLVELMGEGLILPYIDVPFQHVNERILKSMRRPGNIEKTLRVIENWRKICPDLAIRSTFITGFPGETQEEFNELLDFLKEAKLDRVGCFPYSDVEGASANSFENPVPLEVREERAQILMETQAQISYQKLQERIGKSYDVLIDDVTEDGEAICRSKYEAPDIDGVIYLKDGKGLKPGQMVRATITDCDEHDLEAVLDKTFTSSLQFKKA